MEAFLFGVPFSNGKRVQNDLTKKKKNELISEEEAGIDTSFHFSSHLNQNTFTSKMHLLSITKSMTNL